MQKANQNIRKAIKDAGVRYFQVADAMGIDTFYFSHLMQRELSPERQQAVMDAIEKAKNE